MEAAYFEISKCAGIQSFFEAISAAVYALGMTYGCLFNICRKPTINKLEGIKQTIILFQD